MIFPERSEQVQLAEADLLVHWARVTTERHNLAQVISESRRDPDLFFCEIDGMDSAKTLLPRLVVKDKDTDPENLLKLHVTCVKYDGTRPDSVYLYTDAFPHDSANTCTVMYQEILKVNAEIITCFSRLNPNRLNMFVSPLRAASDSNSNSNVRASN